jgi:hypothetical protein
MDTCSDHVYSLSFTGKLECPRPAGNKYNLAIIRTNGEHVFANTNRPVSIPNINDYESNCSGFSLMLAGIENYYYLGQDDHMLYLNNISTDLCDASISWYEVAHR